MNDIKLIYNENLIDSKKYFKDFISQLIDLDTCELLSDKSLDVDFEIQFNNKIIYTLDDNFDCDGKITNSVLVKSLKTIQNSILSSKSKDVSRVDDIGIDDY